MSKLRNASRIFVGHQEEKRHVFAPVQGSSAAYFRIYENELHVYNHVRKCRCGMQNRIADYDGRQNNGKIITRIWRFVC